jgi:hypothetical protein
MTALWVSLGVAVAAVVAWRIRRATKVLDRILTEELDRPDTAAATERDDVSDSRRP